MHALLHSLEEGACRHKDDARRRRRANSTPGSIPAMMTIRRESRRTYEYDDGANTPPARLPRARVLYKL